MSTLHPTEWIHVQRKLFTHLKTMVESRTHYAFIEELQSLLNIRKTAAYKRMNGLLPLRMPELLVLMKTYDVRFQDFLEDPGAAYLKLTDNQRPGMMRYPELLMEVQREILAVATEPKAVCFYSSPSFPLILFTSYPEIVYFHWYSEMYFLEKLPNRPVFDPHVLTRENRFTSPLRSIQKSLDHIDWHVFIAPGCLDILLTRMGHLVEIGVLPKQKAMYLLHQLNEWRTRLRESCENARDGFFLWHSSHFPLSDALLLKSPAQESLISQLFTPLQSTSTNRILTGRMWQQLNIIRDHACLLNRGNGTSRSRWFHEISEKINRLESRLADS